MVGEILYWKFTITKLNNKSLYGHEIPHLFIYSDASNTGLASVYKENGKLNMCKKNFNFIEETVDTVNFIKVLHGESLKPDGIL